MIYLSYESLKSHWSSLSCKCVCINWEPFLEAKILCLANEPLKKPWIYFSIEYGATRVSGAVRGSWSSQNPHTITEATICFFRGDGLSLFFLKSHLNSICKEIFWIGRKVNKCAIELKSRLLALGLKHNESKAHVVAIKTRGGQVYSSKINKKKMFISAMHSYTVWTCLDHYYQRHCFFVPHDTPRT